MTQKIKKRSLPSKRIISSPFSIYWDKRNYLYLIAGFALLVIGYYLMSLGSWDSTESLIISPIILVVAYILIFPLSIFSGKKNSADKNKVEHS